MNCVKKLFVNVLAASIIFNLSFAMDNNQLDKSKKDEPKKSWISNYMPDFSKIKQSLYEKYIDFNIKNIDKATFVKYSLSAIIGASIIYGGYKFYKKRKVEAEKLALEEKQFNEQYALLINNLSKINVVDLVLALSNSLTPDQLKKENISNYFEAMIDDPSILAQQSDFIPNQTSEQKKLIEMILEKYQTELVQGISLAEEELSNEDKVLDFINMVKTINNNIMKINNIEKIIVDSMKNPVILKENNDFYNVLDANQKEQLEELINLFKNK